MSGTQQNAGTGSQTLASGTASITPIGYGYSPPEGSRALYTQYNWASAPSFYEDGSQVVAKGLETCIQGVFIDNSTVAMPVTIYINPHQSLICPAYSQGVFPVFFSGNPQYEISVPNTLAIGTTRLTWLNIPVSPCVWATGFQVDGGQNYIIVSNLTASFAIKVGPGRLATVVIQSGWTGAGSLTDGLGGPPLFFITTGDPYVATLNTPFKNGLYWNQGGSAGQSLIAYT
jgi:hypothetical protein